MPERSRCALKGLIENLQRVDLNPIKELEQHVNQEILKTKPKETLSSAENPSFASPFHMSFNGKLLKINALYDSSKEELDYFMADLRTAIHTFMVSTPSNKNLMQKIKDFVSPAGK